MVYCPTNYLPQRLAQLAVRKPWLDSLLTKLVGAMGHGSLPLAIAPPAFPRGRLVFSACRAAACGFVMGDSGQRSVPAWVVESPRTLCFRWERRSRSAVAALIESSWVRHSSVRCRCPCRSSASRGSAFSHRSDLRHARPGRGLAGPLVHSERDAHVDLSALIRQDD
jgi:hypothetical protein